MNQENPRQRIEDAVTGCTFGNNALIFRDYGKTAFTLARRNGEGLRVSVRADRVLEERSVETTKLVDKIVVQRAASEEEVFDIRNVIIEVPSYARIFPGATCPVCGESVMEPRVR
jgi:formylmethanofuran dehydrogenase subunit E